MRIVITAVGPDNRGLADPIIHYVTGEGANIAEIQMYDHDEERLFAMLVRIELPERAIRARRKSGSSKSARRKNSRSVSGRPKSMPTGRGWPSAPPIAASPRWPCCVRFATARSAPRQR